MAAGSACGCCVVGSLVCSLNLRLLDAACIALLLLLGAMQPAAGIGAAVIACHPRARNVADLLEAAGRN
jgi:hypothetical protein